MARLTARQQERAAALRPAPPAPPVTPPARTPAGEALAMLRRRGFHPTPWPPDLPFPPDFDESHQERLARQLDRYAFRLFLRGAIQHASGFRPSEATRYVDGATARSMAEELVALGLAEPKGRLRPDLALFVVDTALRLGDKVVPMLAGELTRRADRPTAPLRVAREVWSLTPRLFAVGAKGDLGVNVAAAVASGHRGLVSPVLVPRAP